MLAAAVAIAYPTNTPPSRTAPPNGSSSWSAAGDGLASRFPAVYTRTRLVHATCGHPVSVGYYCPDSGKGVRGADVSVKRGRARASR